MKRIILSVLLTLGMLATLGVGFSTTVSAAGPAILQPGAVFAMTNALSGNAVVAFNRAADGVLTYAETVSTGGLGSGPPTTPPPPIDPLASQGSLILTDNGKWLLACNAGSNEITVFRVESGGLVKTDKVKSGGTFPVSLTVFGDEVFVLNAKVGPSVFPKSPNITGFELSNKGQLDPIDGSTKALRPVGAYHQVGFSNNGKWLVVTDSTGHIMVFRVADGIPGAPKDNLSAAGPFAFMFDVKGHLLVADVGAGAASSYDIDSNGTLDLISSPVVNGQGAVCWIAGYGSNVYTTSPGGEVIEDADTAEDDTGGTISAYKDTSGTIALSDDAAASGFHAIDEGISHNGKYLYGLDPVAGGIVSFQITSGGKLSPMGTTSTADLEGTGPTFAPQGIAVW